MWRHVHGDRIIGNIYISVKVLLYNFHSMSLRESDQNGLSKEAIIYSFLDGWQKALIEIKVASEEVAKSLFSYETKSSLTKWHHFLLLYIYTQNCLEPL